MEINTHNQKGNHMKKLILAVALCTAASSANATTGKEIAWIEKAERYVSLSLKDPSSAQFSSKIYRGGGVMVVCGKVNSKNAFGGYTGYKQFITNGVNILAFRQHISDFDVAWRKMCK